jgi:hypothetical protein
MLEKTNIAKSKLDQREKIDEEKKKERIGRQARKKIKEQEDERRYSDNRVLKKQYQNKDRSHKHEGNLMNFKTNLHKENEGESEDNEGEGDFDFENNRKDSQLYYKPQGDTGIHEMESEHIGSNLNYGECIHNYPNASESSKFPLPKNFQSNRMKSTEENKRNQLDSSEDSEGEKDQEVRAFITIGEDR